MTKSVFYAFILFSMTLVAYAQGFELTDSKIPWGTSQELFAHNTQYLPGLRVGRVNSFIDKKNFMINGISFEKTLNFVDSNGLAQISYLANLKNESYQTQCMNIKNIIGKIYGQETNDVQIGNQSSNNYTEIIWTSKTDRIVRLFCYGLNKNNYVSISIYPRWTVLDCTMHNADEPIKKAKVKRAFFYFDKANEEIRFFNNYLVTLPFDSTFKSQRIEFTHNNLNDRTTIDLNSGVIMSKFSDTNGHDLLLVGKCKIQ